MQRNLVTSVLLYETIRTTKKRAEVIRPMIDRLITVAKSRPAHIAIRYINAVVMHKNASYKIMEVLKDRYATRTSGFTRMVPLGMRIGDGADLVNLMLVDAETAPVAGKVTDKKPSAAATKKLKAPKAAKAAPKKKETSATAEKAESASSSAS
jgi:large subunit ribosomal protein L17